MVALGLVTPETHTILRFPVLPVPTSTLSPISRYSPGHWDER